MNKKVFSGCLTAILIVGGIVVLSSAAYTVNMREQVIITQFGEPQGEPVKKAGLHFKVPFIQKVNTIELPKSCMLEMR